MTALRKYFFPLLLFLTIFLSTGISTYAMGDGNIDGGGGSFGTGSDLNVWRNNQDGELKKEFYEKERELHVLGEEDFDQYLNRLLQRKLVVCGSDYVGADALFDLIGHLHLQAVPSNFFVKAATFTQLLLSGKVPLKTALCIFHSVRLDPTETKVMQLLKNQDLSAAEVILCNENHIFHLKDSAALMEALYNDESTDDDAVVINARTSESRYPILSAIANLYLKQQIVFQLV